MSKRISIVTWLGNGNYGTALQAFALFHKIELLGYNVRLLNKIGVVRSIKEAIESFRGKQNKSSLECLRVMDSFWKRYGKVRNVYSILPKFKLLRDTDLFLNGSDQVWNTFFYFDPFYFLSFAGKKRRAAYASSIGTDSVNPKYADKVAKYLSKYSHIGVREQSGVVALRDLTGRNDIRLVADPTFLLSAGDWNDLLEKSTYLTMSSTLHPYLFVYLIGKNQEYQDIVNKIAKDNGFENVVVLEARESGLVVRGTVNLKDIDPLQFVRLIKEASMICTDSFHATAISMNMRKQFVVLKRFKDSEKASQNSRLYDLLYRYGLQDRIYKESVISEIIDYSAFQDKLSKDIEDSESFLIAEIENR